MIYFYLIAILPLIAGAIQYAISHRITWWEWLASAAAGFLVSGIFHAIAICGMTADVETWSGQISRTVYYPEWVEEYHVPVTTTDSEGNSTTTIETRYQTHYRYWTAETSIGDEYRISEAFHNEIRAKFNSYIIENVWKSGFYSGDRNIYSSVNKTGYCFPITSLRSFTNRVKATPSLFSFHKVGPNIPVFEYPQNTNPFSSNRLLGTAANTVNLLEWDRMNARVGPSRGVNVILIGFEGGIQLAFDQQAKWAGGKKNDLVLCYGPGWSYVFGWTEAEELKAKLNTILLQNPVNTELIPKIEAEIAAGYVKTDWHKFDYLTIEPPTWSYWVLILIMLLTQGVMAYVFHTNQVDKIDNGGW